MHNNKFKANTSWNFFSQHQWSLSLRTLPCSIISTIVLLFLSPSQLLVLWFIQRGKVNLPLVERMDGTSHPKIVDLSLYGSRGSMESSQGSWKILFCPWQRMGHFRNLFQLGCLGVKAWCALGRRAWPSFLISGAICSVGSIGPSKQIGWAQAIPVSEGK